MGNYFYADHVSGNEVAPVDNGVLDGYIAWIKRRKIKLLFAFGAIVLGIILGVLFFHFMYKVNAWILLGLYVFMVGFVSLWISVYKILKTKLLTPPAQGMYNEGYQEEETKL